MNGAANSGTPGIESGALAGIARREPVDFGRSAELRGGRHDRRGRPQAAACEHYERTRHRKKEKKRHRLSEYNQPLEPMGRSGETGRRAGLKIP